MSQYKVFLCHNSNDKPQVRQIRDQLRQKGIATWMDEKDIIGFDDWNRKIKENIPQINAVAVFLGSSGFGDWQQREIILIEQEISRRQNRKFFWSKQETTLRVGLVLLPSCQQTFKEIRNKYSTTPYAWLFDYQVVDWCTSKAPEKELIRAIIGKPRDSNLHVDLLLSERGVDYRRLRNLLTAGEWKEADQETFAVMLKATGGKSLWDFDPINNFPCTDLRTIDQLWVKYSDGRFGLSVQKRIWESVGKDSPTRRELLEYFGVRVGWWGGKWKRWLYYEDLTFNINAPHGHLPAMPLLEKSGIEGTYDRGTEYDVEDGGSNYGVFLMGMFLMASCLFSRVQTCKL
ncbi:hypothetical protein BZZ01_15265 [Nostocales cyanobacterium HT-58-2]|nr:hypothetical protein BZZ01_15265 [Nostocales cyanobacterium HT-58-2]